MGVSKRQLERRSIDPAQELIAATSQKAEARRHECLQRRCAIRIASPQERGPAADHPGTAASTRAM